MAQGLFAGATMYEMQSSKDILDDIKRWIEYTLSAKKYLLERTEKLKSCGFWLKIPFDFQALIVSTTKYCDTIIFDLSLVKKAIIEDCITERSIKLLKQIGVTAVDLNIKYGQIYKQDLDTWCDYGNPDFILAEDMYKEGRDFVVTLIDVSNAAVRLEEYMESEKKVCNIIHNEGSIVGSQIQQGSINSTQELENFDYTQIENMLFEIKKILDESINSDYESIKSMVSETMNLVRKKENPSKIRKFLGVIKELAIGIGASIIVNIIDKG